MTQFQLLMLGLVVMLPVSLVAVRCCRLFFI